MINKDNWLSFIALLFRRIFNIIKFSLDYFKFKKFLKSQNNINQIKHNDSQVICVTIIPWLGSAVPWYAIVIALMLYKNGRNVFILFDDTSFGDDALFNKVQSKLILKILITLPLKFIKLSSYSIGVGTSSEIDHLLKLNSLHYTHGETNQELRQKYESIVEEQLTTAYFKIAELYKEKTFSQILVPGGIWGTSGIYTLFSKKYNVQFFSYDSDENELWMSNFGVAAQLKDIPYSFDRLLKNMQEKNFAIQKGWEQLKKRRDGKDDTQSHFLKPSNSLEFGNDYYLMLLNSVWDTAALGLHSVYGSMIDWIFDSIEWVLKNTDKKIIIRQHPAERVKQVDNTDSYKEKIDCRFGNNKRIIFIEAKDDINTYDLIENTLCVLGFSSTSIVESVMLGKPAIIVSNTYYSNFGIVYDACDKKEYYTYLQKASKNELKITKEMNDRACVSNYITQSCNLYKTEFTPVRNNFLKWTKLTLEELEKDYLPLQAILENTPLSILQHEKILNDNK
tara:strand:+ start:610 stop:2130 length:1521 start_codon:yes stop_codon:yes gene_type:complete